MAMMPTLLLPRFFALESGGRYLRVTESSGGLLKFDEEQIWNPRVKFAVERAETTTTTTTLDDVGPEQQQQQQLVHIRCCYNNKYLEALPAPSEEDESLRVVISASGEKPNEDRSKVSCTLFEVQPVEQDDADDDGKKQGAVRLRFVQKNGMYAGRYMSSSTTSSSNNNVAAAMHDDVMTTTVSEKGTIFNVINWDKLVILPPQVSFRSEELDGNYLCSRSLDPRWPYQRFESDMDIGDPVVAKVLHPTPNGNYRIKDVYFNKFWRRSPNWIFANAADTDTSNDTLFSIVKISDTLIGLRNLGNNYFCGGLTTEGKTNCLNAHYPSISKQAKLMIQERVLRRDISDIKYRLSDSRIYDEHIQQVSHAYATNDSPDNPSTITLNYSISESRTTNWSNSISLSLGVSTTFTTSIIPIIASGKVTVSTETRNTYTWGVSETTTTVKQATYAVVVPPLTSMKVTLMATKGTCQVPFSYTQTDLLPNGETVITTKDDGVYTGINTYDFYFQSSKVPQGKTSYFIQ